MGFGQTRVLVLDAAHQRSAAVSNFLSERGFRPQCVDCAPPRSDGPLPDASIALVVMDGGKRSIPESALNSLLSELQNRSIATLLWGGDGPTALPAGGLVDSLPDDASFDEIYGRMAAMARLAPLIRSLESELTRLERLGRHLNRHFEEIDKEMRMAGRLQRDFMPRTLPRRGRARCAQLYRPATWVSGDLFDAFLVDEQNIGLFVADAMGHGTAAGLMTMFIRKLVNPKQILPDGYRNLAPSEVLAELHDGLARHELPNAQFVTAAYALLNVETGVLDIARGGHPFPYLITAEGTISPIRCEGGLLGIPEMTPEFSDARLTLNPGDKLLFYTDGLEDELVDPAGGGKDRPLLERLAPWATLDAEALVARIAEHLDQQEGSLNPADDITVLAVQFD